MLGALGAPSVYIISNKALAKKYPYSFSSL